MSTHLIRPIVVVCVVWCVWLYVFHPWDVYSSASIDQQVLSDIDYNSISYDDPIPNKDILHQDHITTIVIHHTATDPNQSTNVLYNSIQRNHWARRKRWGIDKTWQQMMYHRLIWARGDIYWDKPFNEEWWWMLNNNNWVIHIALQGNFEKNPPTQKQYELLEEMVRVLRNMYWDIPVVWHWSMTWEHTSCPWRLFDISRYNTKKQIDMQKITAITPTTKTTPKIIKSNTYTTFNVSRYYSPTIWQRRYYNNKTYEADVVMNCWKDWIWNNNCLYPASWIKYTNWHKNISVACPPKYKIGTKIALSVQWQDHIVTCHDRWSAIRGNRLDMYCGVGDYALDNWRTCISGTIQGRIL